MNLIFGDGQTDALTFSRNLASDSEPALLIADARQNTNAQSNPFSLLLSFFFCTFSSNPTTVPFPFQSRITVGEHRDRRGHAAAIRFIFTFGFGAHFIHTFYFSCASDATMRTSRS